MRVGISLLAAATLATLVATASASDEAPEPQLPKCITLTAEARASRGGYDHVVHLMNKCGAAASCTVSTDLRPDPIWADLPMQKDTEVVTLRGSAEATFHPHAFCIVDDD